MPDAENESTPQFSAEPLVAAHAGLPQFATAEYAHLPATETCALCGQLLGQDYYRMQEKKLCAACAGRMQRLFPQDSHAAFTRALLVGVAAAAVALAVYAAFTIVTHIYLGYLALGVGWFIAKAMLKASGGAGGRKYQVTAVALTYAAIALAQVPIALSHLFKDPSIHVNLFALLLHLWPRLLWLGLTSPFHELRQPIQGLLGLFILSIGLRIAWQLTRQRAAAIDGPFPIA